MPIRPTTWAEANARILASPMKDFATRFRLMGLDPACHARYADFAEVDFVGSDLAGFDFTGAKLYRAKFKGAKISGARFEQALLDAVDHDNRTTDRRDLVSGPHAPAHLRGAARLRDADDWKTYSDPGAWRLPDRPPNDDYLFTGAIFQDAFAPEMVVVPNGSYLQGYETEPVDGIDRREVTNAHRLAVGRYPVTFEEWDFCYDDKGTKHKPKAWGRDRQPVVNVSWNDITMDYLPWINRRLGLSGTNAYRLLTEAEWEYCCRAGTETKYSFGNRITKSHAQYSEFNHGTVKVGSFPSNAWGLHDMHGNVWEWCQNIYRDGSARDYKTTGPDKSFFRVLRGGSFYDRFNFVRATSRRGHRPDIREFMFGFRLARTLNP